MIRWPTGERLPAHVRANLEHLKGSAALLDQEADPKTWVFDALPWSEDRPVRVILRNDRSRPLEIVLEADGTWRRGWLPEVPRF